jgi:hypothetical protein
MTILELFASLVLVHVVFLISYFKEQKPQFEHKHVDLEGLFLLELNETIYEQKLYKAS